MLFRLLFRDSMVVYAAYEPPKVSENHLERAAAIEFIKDGFSFVAALVPPVWLLAHSLWLEFAAYLAVVGVLIAGLDAIGLDVAVQALIALTLNVWFGFEAAGLRRWNLERSGWTLLGTVTGTSLLDCERRFFDIWLPGTPPHQDA